MAEALERAKTARLAILDIMLQTIAEPNPTLKPHAPRIETVLVPVEKIGAIIGPGGKTSAACKMKPTPESISMRMELSTYPQLMGLASMKPKNGF